MSTSNDTNSSTVHDPAAVRENKKQITVRASDGEDFELEEKYVALELGTIKTFLEAPGVSQDTVLFPFPRMQSWQMMMVIKYCTKFLKLKAKLDGDEELKTFQFQAEFNKDLSNESILQLCTVAHYLNITCLLDFLIASLAHRTINMNREDIRKLFGLD
ncbi:hypothetical protein ACLB2K_028610 [Fragaria x ananassa]